MIKTDDIMGESTMVCGGCGNRGIVLQVEALPYCGAAVKYVPCPQCRRHSILVAGGQINPIDKVRG